MIVVLALASCHRQKAQETAATGPAPPPAAAKPTRPPIPERAPVPALAAGETYVYERGVARRETIAAAREAGLLDVDLTDVWAPFILQDGDGDGAKPNAYRETFVGLASDTLDADGDPARPGEHNYLEVFGIPPTLPVLAARTEAEIAPAREVCIDAVDRQGLEQWTGDVIYLDRDRARREYEQALQDAQWIDKALAAAAATPVAAAGADGGMMLTAAPAPAPPLPREAAIAKLRDDPKLRGRVDRYVRGQARLRAVRAVQTRLVCEGLLSARSRYTPGMYDLQTHEALAVWERKHDIFGWGFLGGETLGMLLRPPRELASRRSSARWPNASLTPPASSKTARSTPPAARTRRLGATPRAPRSPSGI